METEEDDASIEYEYSVGYKHKNGAQLYVAPRPKADAYWTAKRMKDLPKYADVRVVRRPMPVLPRWEDDPDQ